ncbi:reverse transcriptase domain-containing protein [Tanacetum coccineum]
MILATTPLVGFSGEIIWPLGQISLLVKIGDEEHSTSAWMNFMVVRSPSPYNGIIGRPGVRKIRAIPSTAHEMLKFPVVGGIVTLRSSKIIPLECSMVSESGVPQPVINRVAEEKIQVAIHPEYPEQTVAISSTLTEEGRKELCGLLRRHLDVFAWKPADMTGVSRHVAEHRLNIREGCLPVRQKKRGQAPERNKAICEEVKKLVDADIMKEVHYHSWLSNPVMVKKHDGSWRMCVDFKDLNKACPKDGYPLPEIDWKEVDINKKTENQAKMTKLSMEWKRLCKIKAKCGPDDGDGKQVPIYFVSRALQGPEINYTPMEKLILVLVSASKRLKRYFQAHTIVVITDQPIKQLLANPEVTGRLLKWRFELEEHDIQYRPRTSIKGQILAAPPPPHFIVERPEDDTLDTPMEDREELPDPWVLFTDGSSCIDGSEAGLIITNPEGMEFTYALRFWFNATNNEAEYEALIAGLRIAGQMGVQNLQANMDSKLVANQEKSIDEKEVLAVVEEEGHTWMTPVYEYLTEGILPKEKRKARAVRRKAGRYAVINETLYKKSFLGPWLRCVGPLQANYVLREIHEGSCSMHSGPRSVVAKSLRSGYYWPTVHTDARNLIRECSDCQVHRLEPRNPQEKLTSITSPWPFYKFGLPGETVSDNRKQFRDNPFKDWCEKLSIRQCFASVRHPQANGFVERANRSLRKGINVRLGEKNKNWVKEISHVLWAHRTMIKSSKGETPFSLTYGAEAVIPVEIGMLTLRTTEVDMIKNNEALGINLDLLEKKREQAAIQEARSKAKMEKYYNARVRSISFRLGDLCIPEQRSKQRERRGQART